MTAASKRPARVTGTRSPYPTVVSVTTAHHIAAGMLENTSDWASFSTKYISAAATTNSTSNPANVANSWLPF